MLFMLAAAGWPGAGELNAQYIEVSAKLDTNQVLIGDQFHYLVKVSQPGDFTVSWPEFGDTLVDKLEILSRTLPDTTPGKGNQIDISWQYLLTSFDSGRYIIPPMKFRFSKGERTDSIESNPAYLAVYTVPLDSAGRIFDVKAPLNTPFSIAEVWPYIVGGGILLLIVALAIRYFRRRKMNQPLLGPVRPPEAPHIIALRELDALSGEKLWQQDRIKEYYTRLTGIIRRYMFRRFGIPAMELTTYEILDQWERKGMHRDDLKDRLRELLGLADLVKFAREKPLPSFNEANLNHAYEFVKKTMQVRLEGAENEQENTGTVRPAETT